MQASECQPIRTNERTQTMIGGAANWTKQYLCREKMVDYYRIQNTPDPKKAQLSRRPRALTPKPLVSSIMHLKGFPALFPLLRIMLFRPSPAFIFFLKNSFPPPASVFQGGWQQERFIFPPALAPPASDHIPHLSLAHCPTCFGGHLIRR